MAWRRRRLIGVLPAFVSVDVFEISRRIPDHEACNTGAAR